MKLVFISYTFKARYKFNFKANDAIAITFAMLMLGEKEKKYKSFSTCILIFLNFFWHVVKQLSLLYDMTSHSTSFN